MGRSDKPLGAGVGNAVETDHELVRAFAQAGWPLNATLTEMLNEHYSHQTERRGCGYTQASRVLAAAINQPRNPVTTVDLELLASPPIALVRMVLAQAGAHGLSSLEGWRNLDQNPQVMAFLQTAAPSEFASRLGELVQFFQTLRGMHTHLQYEESQLMVQLLQDLILPHDAQADQLPQIRGLHDKPKVGSCTMAEKFFLEIAHQRIPRVGKINVLVDEHGTPLLLEKLNMGDSHSCISLTPLILNGVRLPIGSMFSTQYSDPDDASAQHPPPLRPLRTLKGHVMAVTAYEGYCLLRLSTLTVSRQNRKRAFSTHFKWQGTEGLYSYDTIEMAELIELAHQQVQA